MQETEEPCASSVFKISPLLSENKWCIEEGTEKNVLIFQIKTFAISVGKHTDLGERQGNIFVC